MRQSDLREGIGPLTSDSFARIPHPFWATARTFLRIVMRALLTFALFPNIAYPRIRNLGFETDMY